MMVIFTKFEGGTIILYADKLRDLVSFTFDLLTLDSGCTWRNVIATSPPSLKILALSIL